MDNLGMKQGSLLFFLSGCAFVPWNSKQVQFRPIVDKILAKFTTWEGKFFSLENWVCLVKYVITLFMIL